MLGSEAMSKVKKKKFHKKDKREILTIDMTETLNPYRECRLIEERASLFLYQIAPFIWKFSSAHRL